MPIFDTPITTDDASIKKVLGQKQPALVVLHDSSKADKPLEDALKKVAKKHSGDLLVVRVDANENPATLAKYDSPTLPALLTLTTAYFGRDIKSRAEAIRPSDVRAHVAHLLEDAPLPENKASNGNGQRTTASAKPVNVSDKTFRDEVLKSKTPVLVDFWAEWCGPCRTIAPYIEQIAQEHNGKLKVAKLDTDSNQVIARRYEIRSIPTFILFEGGQPAARISGANPGMIRRMIADHVN